MSQDTRISGQTPRARDRPVKPSKEQRRLAILKRTGLFGASPFGAEITRACTLEELREAYGLVYDIFLAVGYTDPHECRMRIRTFEALPDTATFIARYEGKVIGVLSLVIDCPGLGIPSDVAFQEELDSLRRQGVKLCETTNQAMTPRFRKTAITTQLMRCSSAQALLEDRDGIIISVSPSHMGFYELLGFVRMSEVRSYSSKHYDPVVMMCLYTAKLKEKDPDADVCWSFVADYLSFKNPFVRLVEGWRREAGRHFFEVRQLEKLFLADSGLLARCTEAEREVIRRTWGDGVYVGVTSTAKQQRNIASDARKTQATLNDKKR